MNVYQRINEIRKKVPYIKKDANVTGGQNYRAVTHDNVTSVTRQYFIEAGIVIVPRQVKGELRDTGKTTKSGTPWTVYDAFYEVDFVNIDEPTDRFTIPVGSVAEDTSDKGPGKAMSYATKYAVLKVLMIETGESDESRNPDQNVTYVAGKDLENIKSLLKETNANEEAFLEVALAETVEKIPTARKTMLLSMLNRKKAEMRQPGED